MNHDGFTDSLRQASDFDGLSKLLKFREYSTTERLAGVRKLSLDSRGRWM